MIYLPVIDDSAAILVGSLKSTGGPICHQKEKMLYIKTGSGLTPEPGTPQLRRLDLNESCRKGTRNNFFVGEQKEQTSQQKVSEKRST